MGLGAHHPSKSFLNMKLNVKDPLQAICVLFYGIAVC